MSLLCIVFLLDFAAISDIYGEEEGEVLLLSEIMKTTVLHCQVCIPLTDF